MKRQNEKNCISQNLFLKSKSSTAGITLIALIITIIILLILAGISIGMLSGDNGVLKQAGNAKTQTDIAEEKEILQTSALSAMGKSKYGEVTKEKLDNELDKNVGSTNYSSESVDDGISVTFTNSRRIYIVDSDGNISEYKPILATAIEVDKTTDSVGIDDSITLTATIIPSNSAARIAWVLDEGESYATLNTSTGEVTGTQQGENKVKVKAKAINPDGTEVESSNTCTITVTASPFIDYSYVNYPVEYTDVYTGTSYKKNVAWRLLTPDSILGENAAIEGQEATYTGNVEIISTGIPAKLYYHYETVKTIGWAGKEETGNQQRTNYYNRYYSYKNNINNENIYAGSGLYYNFKDIVFNVVGTTTTLNTGSREAFSSSGTRNYGGFIWIKNGNNEINVEDQPTGEDLFKVESLNSGSVSNIKEINLEDINETTKIDSTNSSIALAQITAYTDKRQGLFRLDQYTKDSNNHGNSEYWLATPYYVAVEPNSTNYDAMRYLYYVNCLGSINKQGRRVSGVRPIVSISGVTLKREAGSHVWKIVKTLE